MHRFLILSSIVFFSFILWIIYLANSGSNSIFFDLVRVIPYGDKLGHIGLFGMLSFIITLTTKGKSLRVGEFHIYYGALIVFLFAFIEEISQAFISSRTFDITDLVADIIGISCAVVISQFYFRRKEDIIS